MISEPAPPKLYSQLAEWWPLLSPATEYVEEAGFYRDQLKRAGDQPAKTLVEFGCGGGNNASHLKSSFDVTLVELSPEMLAISRQLNPECQHFLGDMRSVRLSRQFDRVFIHDAICYMTSIDDLQRAMETSFVHCRPGGAALFAPDFVRETFHSYTDHNGEDTGDRGLRYLEWVWDPDPVDSTYVVDYAYILRNADGSTSVEHERHVEGLFSRAEWLQLLAKAGFEGNVLPFLHSEVDYPLDVFIGVRPRS